MPGNPDILDGTLSKVRVLQVDQDPENLAELDAGLAAGHTVNGWQMPKDSRPGDLVIWYRAGRQQYVARGWVDGIPKMVSGPHGRYQGPVGRMERIKPVDRTKVIDDCGFDGGVESYQTVDEELAPDFLQSLGLSHLASRFKVGQICSTCYQRMAYGDLRQLRLIWSTDQLHAFLRIAMQG